MKRQEISAEKNIIKNNYIEIIQQNYIIPTIKN